MGIYDFNDAPEFIQPQPDFRSDIEQSDPSVQLDNPESPDLAMAQKMAEESIAVSGAHIEVYLRTNNSDIDNTWNADADPTYWPPLPMKAFFVPKPIEAELVKWGVDAPTKTEVVFARSQVLGLCKRVLRIGDVFKLPYNSANQDINPQYFVVTNAQETGNYRYTWLYVKCQVETLAGDITLSVNGRDTLGQDDYYET